MWRSVASMRPCTAAVERLVTHNFSRHLSATGAGARVVTSARFTATVPPSDGAVIPPPPSAPQPVKPTASPSSSSPAASPAATNGAGLLSGREVRLAVNALLPPSGSMPLEQLLQKAPPTLAAFLRTAGPEKYFAQVLGSEFRVVGGIIYTRTVPPKNAAGTATTAGPNAKASTLDPPKPSFAPPKPPTMTSSTSGPNSGGPGGLGGAGALRGGFRTPPEVLEVFIEFVPTFAVRLDIVEAALPPDVRALVGTMSLAQFLKKYRFYFDVQQHHGQMEVKLRPDVSHAKRGVADVKYAAGVGSADIIANSAATASSGMGTTIRPPRSSEANLVMGLAPKCPSEFVPLGDFLAKVHSYVSEHPAFDSRIGVSGLLEKYPEYFQIVEGKIRVRPSTVAPGATGELSAVTSPLKDVVQKLLDALPPRTSEQDLGAVEMPKLFTVLGPHEKLAIKELYRTFPRFLRLHGKAFCLGADSTVRRFVPEWERSADSLASERSDADAISPSDPIHQIPAAMDDGVEADWAVRELYEALPLMQAAVLDDFRLILTQPVRDALPKDLAAHLKRFPEYFAVWEYPDDPATIIVQRAKLVTPAVAMDDLARAMAPLVPQGGIDADRLLRKLPVPMQRYLYRHGLRTTIKAHLTSYFAVAGERVLRLS